MLKLLSLIFLLLLTNACGSTAKVQEKTNKKETAQLDNTLNQKAVEHFTAGSLLQSQGNFSDALNSYYEALLFDDKSAELYNAIAFCLVQLKKFDSAEINLQKSKKLDDKNPETLMMLGGVYIQNKKLDEAFKEYSACFELDKTNNKAFEMILYIYEYQNKQDELIKFVEKHAEEVELSSQLAYMISGYYFNLKNYEKAAKWIERSLTIDSANKQAILLKNQIDLVTGKSENALKSLNEMYKTDPENQELLLGIVEVLRNDEKSAEIIGLLENKKNLSQPNKLYFGEAYYRTANFQKIIDTYADIDLDVLDVYFTFLIADAEFKLKNFESSLAYFSSIIRRDPSQVQGYYGSALALYQQKHFEDAEKILQEGLKKAKGKDILYGLLSEVKFELKKDDEAIEMLEYQIKQKPSDFAAYAQAAQAYSKIKNYVKSDSYYEKAISINNKEASILNNYSYNLAERNVNLERAKELISKALEMEPNNSYYLDTMGWIYYQLKDYASAKIYVEKSLSGRESQSAEVLDHLGDIFLALKDTKNALINWKKAYELEPNRNEILQKILEKDKNYKKK